jgi:hypothetical protein
MITCIRLPSPQRHLVPIYYRFDGGPAGFNSFFTNSIKLSDTLCCVVGNLITRISISPEGTINKIDIVNPIDSITESEIIRVIKLSEKHWKKSDAITHNEIFYIQTVISTSDFIPNYYRPFSEHFKRFFLEPIIIVRYINVHQYDIKPIKNETILDQMNILLDSSKYEESLPLVNELIRRDPFNRDLYKVRIMVNYNLDRKEQVTSDNNKLIDFAEGYSLDDILSDKEKHEK